MKLRQKPSDFVVEELAAHEFKSAGKFAVYKVSKVGMTTFAAEKVLATHLDVKFNKIGFAGLKDTHARTSQYFSVETTNPERGMFKERNVTSELAGFLDSPIKTGSLIGNRFEIIVRDLRAKEIETAQRNVTQIPLGVPNYFDSQRFGSLKGVKGFIAKDVLLGDYESAVKKIITATTRHQKAVIRATRRFINAHWGKWDLCLAEIERNNLERTSEGTLLRILIERPTAFKEAFGRTFAGIRELFFSAYQSYIWNECVKRIVRANSKEVFSVEYEAGRLVFPRKWNPDSALGTFPLVGPDMKSTPEIMKIINEILALEKMTLEQFRSDEHMFVAREREIVSVPREFSYEFGDDELNAHKKKALVKFSLSKGSYATIVTKAIFEQ